MHEGKIPGSPQELEINTSDTGMGPHRSRRSALGLAAASAAAWGLRPLGARASECEESTKLTPQPRYFPLPGRLDELSLSGRLAVVTGASRGLGRAIGEALLAHGAVVIGTSRQPAAVPSSPPFPLLALDIADAASVAAFAGQLATLPQFHARGRLDILVNNAGRFVFGRIVPSSVADLPLYATQRDLALRTLYAGPAMVTNALLPLMSPSDYARIVFTVSIAAYYNGAFLPGAHYLDAYFGGKAALRAYVNNLDSALRAAGSAIRVSTINPYSMNTSLAQGTNPICTQPVNAAGLSDTDPYFNQVVLSLREALANGLPPSMAGEACVQLLRMREPLRNVAVASPRSALALQGGNAIVDAQLRAENEAAAVRWTCG